MAEDYQKYLSPRTLAKLEGLELRARHVVEGYVSGMHRSPYHGFSVEFAEHREYVHGDDLRYLDWKLFGRTDKFYLKQYEDETNLICYLLLDTSESMRYQSDPELLSKLEYGQCAAASLAWLVLSQQDAAGLATFDSQVKSLVRPACSASQLKQIIHAIDTVTSEAKTELGPILHDLAERFRRRGIVVLFSDLFDDPRSLLAGVKHLRHRRHDVVVFHLLDPAEMEFPFDGMTLFKGMEQTVETTADAPSLRKAYLEELGRFVDTIRKGCREHQADYRLIRTDASLDEALVEYLASRSRRHGVGT